jgi:hypothetical protein
VLCGGTTTFRNGTSTRRCSPVGSAQIPKRSGPSTQDLHSRGEDCSRGTTVGSASREAGGRSFTAQSVEATDSVGKLPIPAIW